MEEKSIGSEEIEIWNDIPGYEGLYQASTEGRIKSLPKSWVCGRGHTISHNGKILKPFKNKDYLTVKIDNKNKRIHILVAKTFIANPLNLPEVNHKNGKKWDNRKVNLEWKTHLGNIHHAIEVLKRKFTGKLVLDTETGIFFDSLKEAKTAKNIKYSKDALSRQVRGISRIKTTLKYV
jgi:hypothetical protein